MITILFFVICASRVVSGDESPSDLNSLAETNESDMATYFKNGIGEMQTAVTTYLQDLSDSLQQTNSVDRSRRERSISAVKSRFNMFVNFITCRNLVNFIVEIDNIVGNSTRLVTTIVNVGTNVSHSLSKCSGNPICLASVVLTIGQNYKWAVEWFWKYNNLFKKQGHRIANILVYCALGEDMPSEPTAEPVDPTEIPTTATVVSTTARTTSTAAATAESSEMTTTTNDERPNALWDVLNEQFKIRPDFFQKASNKLFQLH